MEEDCFSRMTFLKEQCPKEFREQLEEYWLQSGLLVPMRFQMKCSPWKSSCSIGCGNAFECQCIPPIILIVCTSIPKDFLFLNSSNAWKCLKSFSSSTNKSRGNFSCMFKIRGKFRTLLYFCWAELSQVIFFWTIMKRIKKPINSWIIRSNYFVNGNCWAVY